VSKEDNRRDLGSKEEKRRGMGEQQDETREMRSFTPLLEGGVDGAGGYAQ
jgi:hypothetical protein